VSGTHYAYSKKGWIDHDLFFFFLEKHFLKHAVARCPLLLLLNGHSTHSDLTSLKFANDHEMTYFVYRHIQPMSASLWIVAYSNLSTIECHNFYHKNPGSVISKLNFNLVFRDAWLNTITPANVVSGFRKTGVYPFNRHAISFTSMLTAQGSPNVTPQGML